MLVEEDEIADALRWSLEVPRILLEGSAVLGIAALRAGRIEATDRRVAVVTTGRNIAPDVLRSILA